MRMPRVKATEPARVGVGRKAGDGGPGFRAVQAAADLKALLRRSESDLRGRLAELLPAGKAERNLLEDFVGGPLIALEPEDSRDVRDGLEERLMASAAPDPHLLPLLGLWLANLLLSGCDGTAAPDVWARWRRRLHQSPRFEKASYMNGFREVGPYGYDRLDPLIEPSDCLSEDRETVLAPLRAIAEAATEEELWAISAADRGEQADLHYEKLTEVVREGGSVVPPGDAWIPLESIELRSQTPGTTGHSVAFAVLLVTSIHNDDAHGAIEFRWERQYAELRDLPGHIRDAVLAGVRHLYEANPEWEPTPWRNRKPFDPAMLIPPQQSV